MSSIPMSDVTAQLLAALKEGFDGPAAFGYFTDSGPGAGLVATVGALSAAEASRESGGASIAAHVQHIVFSCDASADWISGVRKSYDWSESWSVKTVDHATWKALRMKLPERHARLRQAIETHAGESVESMGGAIGAVAHLAYHLAAIRQKARLKA
jgi:hypothetical protein